VSEYPARRLETGAEPQLRHGWAAILVFGTKRGRPLEQRCVCTPGH
jgi:hypothetical protein